MSTRLRQKVARYRQLSPEQAGVSVENSRMRAWRGAAATAAFTAVDIKLHGAAQIAIDTVTAVPATATFLEIKRATERSIANRIAFRPNAAVTRIGVMARDADELETARQTKTAWRSVAMVAGSVVAVVATKGSAQYYLDGVAVLTGLNAAARIEDATSLRRKVYGTVFRRTA